MALRKKVLDLLRTQIESQAQSDEVSIWMGNHLVGPQAKLVFSSIAMLISHDITTAFHFAN